MKRKLLIISLALNALLGLWLISHPARKDAATRPATAAPSDATNSPAAPNPLPSAAADAGDTTAPDLFYWATLESADLAVYVKNLRSIQCPEYAVRTVVHAELFKRYRPRIVGIVSGLRDNFYNRMMQFRPGLGFENFVKSELGQLEEVEREMNSLKKAALGPETGSGPQRVRPDGERLTAMADFLEPDQARRAMEVADHYSVKRDEAAKQSNARELQKDLREQEQVELRYILNDEQLAEYNLRRALPASVKQERSTFPASPEEWRKIVELQQAACETNAQNVEVEYAIMQLLGPERGEQFKRHGDHYFRQFVEVTEEAGLPEEIAVAANQVREQAEKQWAELKTQPAPEAYQRKLMEAWRAQTTARIESLLGAENTAAYLNRHGRWLKKH